MGGSVSLINGHIDDDVMTDNEIIKAYGCCNLSHDECGGCDNCPCKIEGDCIVPSGFDLEREVFNLLNRQKAENIDLKGTVVAKNIVIATQKAENDKLTEELKVTRQYLHDNGLEWDLLSYTKRNGG